ncbi:hypothetical protein [Staphylococcus sp. 47.1]|uniref:hypothetical protein n=1 Tax=Staphylococcus sp. 47.1 TaxID=1929484 RepID=UPI000946C3E1|nr:hypothetical protein [Staphylococcus sp. 47.1]OLF30394.1 hypothetical protein BSZ11_12900 [Staphylococcus sp. 47.1]
MKIDLHMHTKKCKRGDSSKRNIEPNNLISTLTDNKVSICSITNHNHFDLNEFNTIYHSEKNFCIFPGIELDIKFDDFHYHIILVCNPKKAYLFHEIFDNEPNRDYESYFLTYDELIQKVKVFSHNDLILIPHFLDKDKERSFNIHNKDKLKEDLKSNIIFLETGNMISMGIINDHNEISLLGSDVTDWEQYSNYYLPEIKFNITSFEKLIELAKDPSLFIKLLLQDSKHFKIKLPNSGISIYEDVNVVFGEKGSGKTILLKEYIYPCFNSSGFKTIFHEGKNYNSLYEKLIKDYEASVSIPKDKEELLIHYLTDILNYHEKLPKNFITNFKEHHSKTLKNKNAKSIKKFYSKFSNNITVDFSSFVMKININNNNINAVMDLNHSTNRNSNKKDKLHLELQDLKEHLISQSISEYKKYFSDKNTESFLESLKNSISKKTGTIHLFNNIGFSKLVSHRLTRLENNHAFKKIISQIESQHDQTLGYLPQKGKVTLNTKISFLKPSDKYGESSPYDRNSIKSNRDIVKKLRDFNLFNYKDINNYFDIEEKNTNPEEFISQTLKKQSLVKINKNENYKPSEGERAILTISSILEDNSYDCYIFDEIERGLGNKYITTYLIPRIKYLRSLGKIIVLSTHNANIAVNTLPITTVYCSYDVNEKNIYYVGNMYSNRLEGIVDSQILAWENKALIHLEGNENMFNIRRNVYGI